MQKFAHVVDSVVRAVETIPDGCAPGKDIFTATYAESLVAVPEAVPVAAGWKWDGKTFLAPVAALEAAKAQVKASARAATSKAFDGFFGHPVHAAAAMSGAFNQGNNEAHQAVAAMSAALSGLENEVDKASDVANLRSILEVFSEALHRAAFEKVAKPAISIVGVNT